MDLRLPRDQGGHSSPSPSLWFTRRSIPGAGCLWGVGMQMRDEQGHKTKEKYCVQRDWQRRAQGRRGGCTAGQGKG